MERVDLCFQQLTTRNPQLVSRSFLNPGPLGSLNPYVISSLFYKSILLFCSDALRIKRLAKILDIEETESQKLLRRIDKEQREYFKKAFGKKDASPYEFDLIINCDHLTEPQGAARIVAHAFEAKFALEAVKK